MARIQKSTMLYPHPFSKAYWRDAALELKDTKMLVVTALMVASLPALLHRSGFLCKGGSA